MLSKLALAVAIACVVSVRATAGEPVLPTAADDPSSAVAVLANAIKNQPIELTYRGKTVSVVGRIVAGTDPCSSMLVAHGMSKTREWARPLNFGDLAWSGDMGQGRFSLVFFDGEAHLPADFVTLTGPIGDAVRHAATQIAAFCQAAAGLSDTMLVGAPGPIRTCYFARLPGLTLVEWSSRPSEPRRAVLTILSRQSPLGELGVLFERVIQAGAVPASDLSKPSVTFAFADPAYKSLGVSDAAFTLDGKKVLYDHSLAAYGATRVRISMDSFGAGARTNGDPSFYDALLRSETAGIVLLAAGDQPKMTLDFDLGQKLAAARRALDAASWSCAAAQAPTTSSVKWRDMAKP